MPAIIPQKLRNQAQELAQAFLDPDAFLKKITYLLEIYADRARRHSQAGVPKPLLFAYSVPQPVLNQVLLALDPYIARNPTQAIALSQRLWAQPNLECKKIALEIIARLPQSYIVQAMSCVQSWIVPTEDIQMIGELLQRGLSAARRQTPQKYLQLVTHWLSSNETFEVQIGLRALDSYVQEAYFQDLPTVLKLLQPLVWKVPRGVRADVLEVIRALAQRAPIEMAYFLEQSIKNERAVDTAWIIRQVLPSFPPDTAQKLRQAMQTSKE